MCKCMSMSVLTMNGQVKWATLLYILVGLCLAFLLDRYCAALLWHCCGIVDFSVEFSVNDILGMESLHTPQMSPSSM
jgi:hypothetical protein